MIQLQKGLAETAYRDSLQRQRNLKYSNRFQKNPKGSKISKIIQRNPKNPKNLKRFQMVQNYSKRFQKGIHKRLYCSSPRPAKLLQELKKNSIRIQKILIDFKRIQNDPKDSKRIQNDPKEFKRIQNTPKLSRKSCCGQLGTKKLMVILSSPSSSS